MWWACPMEPPVSKGQRTGGKGNSEDKLCFPHQSAHGWLWPLPIHLLNYNSLKLVCRQEFKCDLLNSSRAQLPWWAQFIQVYFILLSPLIFSQSIVRKRSITDKTEGSVRLKIFPSRPGYRYALSGCWKYDIMPNLWSMRGKSCSLYFYGELKMLEWCGVHCHGNCSLASNDLHGVRMRTVRFNNSMVTTVV